jgi:hypothetical protein
MEIQARLRTETAERDRRVIAPTAFQRDVMRNRNNAVLLRRLPELGLPQTCLVAGALFQTVWNLQSNRAPEDGIGDYDVFYFDPDDLSSEAEDQISRRAQAVFFDLGIRVDICNQARVHLWYQRYFGHPTQPRTSSEHSVAQFLVRCTCVGYAVDQSAEPRLIAPFGLNDLYAGVLVRNMPTAEPDLYLRKTASYLARWPHLVALAD